MKMDLFGPFFPIRLGQKRDVVDNVLVRIVAVQVIHQLHHTGRAASRNGIGAGLATVYSLLFADTC